MILKSSSLENLGIEKKADLLKQRHGHVFTTVKLIAYRTDLFTYYSFYIYSVPDIWWMTLL